MPSYSQTIAGLSGDIRLDRYVAENLCLLSRSQIKARRLAAKINGKDVKISRAVKNGDLLELCWQEAEPVNIIGEDIPLDILYENGQVVVINKRQGMVVHPGAGNRQGTLANALHYRNLQRGSGSTLCGPRPGIVHRLDKETSGVMIAAYNDEALVFLAEQFRARKARKTYVAIVGGIPKEKKGRIETYIARDHRNRKRFAVAAAGRSALTLYSVVKTWRTHSLILLRPKTGRTHQLRVHLRYLGHPIIGDPLYGIADPLFSNATLMLHSKSLAITLPGETEPRLFAAPLPERFREMIRCLDGDGYGTVHT